MRFWVYGRDRHTGEPADPLFSIAESEDGQLDILDLRSRINRDYQGDLTHKQIRGMLVLVRRLKTRLEVLDAEMENNI